MVPWWASACQEDGRDPDVNKNPSRASEVALFLSSGRGSARPSASKWWPPWSVDSFVGSHSSPAARRASPPPGSASSRTRRPRSGSQCTCCSDPESRPPAWPASHRREVRLEASAQLQHTSSIDVFVTHSLKIISSSLPQFSLIFLSESSWDNSIAGLFRRLDLLPGPVMAESGLDSVSFYSIIGATLPFTFFFLFLTFEVSMKISAAFSSVARLGWGRGWMSGHPSSVLSDAGNRLETSGPLTYGRSILRVNLMEQRLEAIEASREPLSGSRMKAQSS